MHDRSKKKDVAMKRLAFVATALAAAAGCGGNISNADGGADAAADGDVAAPPFDAGAFCSGSAPRLMINGADVSIMQAAGQAIIMNCCDSAELSLATAAYQAMMYVLWRGPAGAGAQTVDLANPPQGFSIEMDLGCDPATTSCASASPEERYTSGFSGTLTYAYSSAGLTVSYCLEVAESPSQPHGVIHSMMLYAPNIVSP